MKPEMTTYPDGTKCWYLNGKQLSKQEFTRILVEKKLEKL
jgi:hypothetical protein